jgi:nicotinamidase-related amidase
MSVTGEAGKAHKKLIRQIATTALLIVDMQIYQAGEGGNLPRYFAVVNGPEAEAGAVRRGREIVPVIKQLLATFRAAGSPVIFMAFGSLTEDGRDLVPYVRLWNKKCGEQLGVPAIVPVSDPGYAIVPELAPLPHEPVVNKTAQGAFNSSNLDQILKQKRVDTLIVTGMYTNHCVLATCIGAADTGYRVIVAEDAVGSWRPDLHEQALQVMRSWIIRSSSGELIQNIKSLSS